MKSLAVVSVFASVALASTSSLIPSGISSGCSTYLTSFDADTSLSACTSTLINATQLFGAAAPSGSTPTASDVDTAIATICGATSTCPSTTIQSELTKFYGACTAELTSNANDQVLLLYDALYTIAPLEGALCTKDDSGNYCVKEIATDDSSSTSVLNTVAQFLWSTVVSNGAVGRRDTTTSSNVIAPNATTFAHSNLLFFFLQPSLAKASLCQTCSRNILMSFITFESNVPYAPGLANSQLLSGQTALYQGVQNVCGASFLSGAVEAAGSLSGGILGGTSGALRTLGNNIGTVGVAMGTIFLGAMLVL